MNFNEKNKTFRAFLKNEVYASYIPQKSANIIQKLIVRQNDMIYLKK